jgi:hypothetical protein
MPECEEDHMFHAPATESKQQTGSAKADPSAREHDSLPAFEGPYVIGLPQIAGGGLRPPKPPTLRQQRLARLQRAYGNQAVLRMLERSGPAIQPKLVVNEPGDAYEQEADRVADQVMRMPAPELSIAAGPPQLSRKCDGCEEEDKKKLQMKSAGASEAAASEAPPIVHEVLRSPGQPLDAPTREFMEPRFGHDFGHVRIHADSRASASAYAVNALAYTVGQQLVFGRGAYVPKTDSGRKLLAHELTHVVQQRASGSTAAQRFNVGPEHGAGEREADAVAADAPVFPIAGTSSPWLQRERLPGTEKNERILDLGSRNGLACCDVNACPDDKNGFACPDDFDCKKETGDSEAKNKPFSKTGHKFSPHLKCDPPCSKDFEPSYSGEELVVALPSGRRHKGKDQCGQTLVLCANEKSVEVTIGEFSNHNTWEASPGVAAKLGIPPDFKGSIYPKANDPDMKDDRNCTPKPTPSPQKPKTTPGKAAGEEGKKLQKKQAETSEAAASEAPPIVHEVLRSPGQPLDAPTRAFFEPRFGYDFSHVRVHTDAKAAESATATNALAFTVGEHIAFASGQYAPGMGMGRQLLAHELTHVVQQRAGSLVLPNDKHVADTTNRVLDGSRASGLLRSLPVVQRQADISVLPKDLPCSAVTGAATPSGTNVFFSTNSTIGVFGPDIDAFANGWVAAGAQALVSVDGYASTTGPQKLNWRLSCDRALAVRDALTARGIPPAMIQVLAHGESNEFDPADPLQNQRVVVSSPGVSPAPVPPVPPVPPPSPLFGVTAALPIFIEGASTPPSMGVARIPPRVPTFVPITINGPVTSAAPVRVSIDGAGGGNGSASINGVVADVNFAAAGIFNLALRGVAQTAPGSAGNLKLVARQGTRVLASTAGFSVSSIPENMSVTLSSTSPPGPCGPAVPNCRGFIVNYAWKSDSGTKADLDQAEISERVESTGTGVFAKTTTNTSCYLSATGGLTDSHQVGADGLNSSGSLTLKQTEMFKDKRSGASDIPVTNSGFLITHVVDPIPGSCTFGFFCDFQVTSSKIGADTVANDPNTTCPSGPIASKAGTGSVGPIVQKV